MSNNNKTYRLKTNIGEDTRLNLNINQEYDILEILSLKVKTENLYRLHSSSYGCIVGRVLANGGVGIPNAKISLFIKADEETLLDDVLAVLYPYNNTQTKNADGIRYNLLPDEQISECHQNVGTFPNKRLVLDDLHVIEIFDKYYKFTTTTNSAGDYMLFGVPVGNQTIHTDIDLSDIGFLSQKPIDMMYKGYNSTQFENAAQFKKDTNIDSLSQIIGQNTVVDVLPFWGDTDEGDIAITRNDIQINYKFEPTCIFIGSLVTDNKSNGFSKKCVPTPKMGRMDYLTTGAGTIEMIRKTPNGDVEEFSIMGNELIDGNGTWCYQIPMNLDYVMSDENGNLVPTDNPEKGIPTRTRVRFRISLNDFESDYANNHLVKMLVPNNPDSVEDQDYTFGSATKDSEEGGKSFRDLMWNNVYTIKSYIPRIQKGNYQRTEKFSGIKNINVHGDNNPIPYNNMRVNLTFKFTLQCAIIKALIFAVSLINKMFVIVGWLIKDENKKCITIGDGLCPDLEGWYFAPGCYRYTKNTDERAEEFLNNTLKEIKKREGLLDSQSTDTTNKDSDDEKFCLTTSINYLTKCIEINLAMENEVIQFDFYNDWINGLLYIPRWFVNIRKKRSYFFGLIRIKPKVQACLEDSFNQTRRLTQQCAMSYGKDSNDLFTYNRTPIGCKSGNVQKCHKTKGRKQVKIFRGSKNSGGIVHNETNMHGLNIYYPKSNEWLNNGKKANLFATDIVLLGNINTCNDSGIPNNLSELPSSTFQLPPNLVQTNMDSDGILYGIDGRSKCNGVQLLPQRKGVSEINQTFDDYVKWSKGEEFYEKTPDDIDEYAITEMSGIDWGFSGPQQGKEKNLYSPGGHFLSIACLNPKVSIKSCVNLSRVCELGSYMSQFQIKYRKASENEIEELEQINLVPSGFISGDEINDNGFRSIFATLNSNKLKVKKDERGNKKYNFISINPINYNGELKDSLPNEYNKKIDDKTNSYIRTIENTSKDYIFYRFNINDVKEHESKFLLKDSYGLSFPVYENSFYFYFGLKNGSSAADRFFKDYYAACPKNEKNIPNIEIIDGDEYVEKNICEKTVKVKFKINNFPTPYSVKIYKNGDFDGYINEDNIGTNIEWEFEEEGEYEIIVENQYKANVLKKKFVINEVFNEDEKMIYYYDFVEEPILSENKDDTYTISNKKNTGSLKITTNDNIAGIIIIGDGKCSYWSKNEEVTEIITNKIKDFGLVKDNVTDNGNDKIFNLWATNTYYDVYYIYNCKTIYKTILVENIFTEFKLHSQPMTVALLGNELTLLKLQKEKKEILIKDEITDNDGLVNEFIKINREKLGELSRISEWVVKKSMMSEKSMFIRDNIPLTFNPLGGTPPYNLSYRQSLDEIDGDKISVYEHYYFYEDYFSQLAPTKMWLNEDIETEGNVENADKNLVFENLSDNKKNKYPIIFEASDVKDNILGFKTIKIIK